MTRNATTAAKMLALFLLLSSCSDRSSTLDDQSAPTVEVDTSFSPWQRAVVVNTSGCGAANDGFGTGVLVDEEHVLTAAHVIASSSSAVVSFGDRTPEDSSVEVVGLDRRTDLALLKLTKPAPASLLPIPTVDVGRVEPADDVQLITADGVQAATVLERSLLRTTEVRGTAPAERVAYRLDVSTERGDSGAGVYRQSPDGTDQLVAVVFADSAGNTDGAADTSWAVAGSEIATFLADTQGEQQVYRCDAGLSKLVVDEP